MNDRKTTVAGILFALAGVVASLPPIPVWREWDSTHIATLILAVAGGAGLHLAADARSTGPVANPASPAIAVGLLQRLLARRSKAEDKKGDADVSPKSDAVS